MRYFTYTLLANRKIMETREETFLRMALEFKKQYEETAWWKFKKRIELKKSWYSARECMIRYGK